MQDRKRPQALVSKALLVVDNITKQHVEQDP
jgi:hypothetical protein